MLADAAGPPADEAVKKAVGSRKRLPHFAAKLVSGFAQFFERDAVLQNQVADLAGRELRGAADGAAFAQGHGRHPYGSEIAAEYGEGGAEFAADAAVLGNLAP